MYSSYQYHYGGQAAAAKGASDSPNKSPGKQPTAAASSNQSSMFVPKVDWGSASGGGGAAALNVSSLSKSNVGIFRNQISLLCGSMTTMDYNSTLSSHDKLKNPNFLYWLPES